MNHQPSAGLLQAAESPEFGLAAPPLRHAHAARAPCGPCESAPRCDGRLPGKMAEFTKENGFETGKTGDGSKPIVPLVNIKIAGIYGCSSH